MPIKHAVRLSPEDRTTLIERTTSGSAHRPAPSPRARILLKADESTDGAAWTDQQIADALDVGLATVARTRKRALERRPHRCDRAQAPRLASTSARSTAPPRRA